MINPVLRREVQTSLRSGKIYATLTVYVFLVAAAAGLYIWGSTSYSYMYGFSPQSMVAMYVVLSCFQLGLVLLTTPALTAGSISGERERQTLDLLLITNMRPFSIVCGKLFSCLLLVLLMTVATLPVFALTFYFGGVSIFSLLQIAGYMLSVSCMVGAIAIFFSTIFKKTVASMVLTYLLEGILCGGTVIGYFIYVTIYWNMYQTEPGYMSAVLFMIFNPAVAFGTILDKQIGTSITDSVFQVYQYYAGGVQVQIPFAVEYFWFLNVLMNAALTVIFLFLASRMIHPLRKKR